MKLTDLDPYFLVSTGPKFHSRTQSIVQAQGLRFLCPKCLTHSVICWSRSRGTPDDIRPGPGRWAMVGTSLSDLTLNADPPSTARSIQLKGGCDWHGFITNGEVTNA